MVVIFYFFRNPQAVLLLAACRTPKPDRLLGALFFIVKRHASGVRSEYEFGCDGEFSIGPRKNVTGEVSPRFRLVMGCPGFSERKKLLQGVAGAQDSKRTTVQRRDTRTRADRGRWASAEGVTPSG